MLLLTLIGAGMIIRLSRLLIGIITCTILATGLILPLNAYAMSIGPTIKSSLSDDECTNHCPEKMVKVDLDRTGHKIVKKPPPPPKKPSLTPKKK